MQHHRILSRAEWLPARRRCLSRERELTRRREPNPERRRDESGVDFDLTDWARRPDEYEDRKERASAGWSASSSPSGQALR